MSVLLCEIFLWPSFLLPKLRSGSLPAHEPWVAKWLKPGDSCPRSVPEKSAELARATFRTASCLFFVIGHTNSSRHAHPRDRIVRPILAFREMRTKIVAWGVPFLTVTVCFACQT